MAEQVANTSDVIERHLSWALHFTKTSFHSASLYHMLAITHEILVDDRHDDMQSSGPYLGS